MRRALAAALLCSASGFAGAAGFAPDHTWLDHARAESALEVPDATPGPVASKPPSDASRPASSHPERWTGNLPTMPWTRLHLAMIVKHKVSPSRSARGLALVHVAMADAFVLARRSPGGSSEPISRAAVAWAAAKVLGYLFPSEEHAFDRLALEAVAAATAKWPASVAVVETGRRVGTLVAERVIAHGEADGAAKGWNGLQLQWYGEDRWYGPGAWEPTPPYFYYPPDEPFAHGWKTWALESPSQYRPVPPAYGSERHVKALLEVLEVQRRLTPEQVKIARFWVDGHGSVTPPGHWNEIALGIAAMHALGPGTVAEMFAALNVALADAFVAAWEAKYYYWTIRPITAARYILGTELKPLLLTPPFPSYVSGHASFSGAAARILGAYFPSEAAALDAMAEEAANSRLLAGIHYRYDNDDGIALGRRVAVHVLEKLR